MERHDSNGVGRWEPSRWVAFPGARLALVMAFGLGGVFEGVQTAANAGVPADSAVAAVAHTICWQPRGSVGNAHATRAAASVQPARVSQRPAGCVSDPGNNSFRDESIAHRGTDLSSYGGSQRRGWHR